jgi:hypothetical protein
LLNSKRGLTVDENGKQLDDEISIISSQVSSLENHPRLPPCLCDPAISEVLQE